MCLHLVYDQRKQKRGSPSTEIDHNFSRAHRIVTTSILPIVEQYAKHSEAVWEGSKFWKQFFEASANVSLSGYEELAQQDEPDDETATHTYDETQQTHDGGADETMRTVEDGHHEYDESLMDNGEGDISGSTPRAPHPQSFPEMAQYDSPYEALKRELKPQSKNQYRSEAEEEPQLPPATPGTEQRLPRMSMMPESSPFGNTSYLPSAATKRQDPLMHRVLDKNYRIAATPHKTPQAAVSKPSWRDMGSPGSSSPLQAPTLHTEMFSSPIRQPALASGKKPAAYGNLSAPRTPGVSVMTPLRQRPHAVPLSFADAPGTSGHTQSKVKEEISWESDSDDESDIYKTLGMSPPKTIQFALPPSKLLQTPAKEASRRIVEDLMRSAGGGQAGWSEGEDSPSFVRPVGRGVDDTF